MKKTILLAMVCAFCVTLGFLSSGPINADDGKSKNNLTFTKDIAPILQQKCQDCHHSGGIAPMPLVNYEEVRPWARAIKEQVVKRVMPPFYATGPAGYFFHDPRLTDEQIAAIAAWADNGAPKGNPSDQPPPLKWSNDWKLGPPDLLLKLPKPYTVEPNKLDNYQLFIPDFVFPEDTWIRAMEIHPGNKQVVHHASLYILPDDFKANAEGRVENADFFIRGGQLFAHWVPGSDIRSYDKGYAALIRKGTRFGIQVHYAPTAKPMTDETSVGFYFANGLIQKQFRSIYGGTDRIEIPPGEANYQISEKRRFKSDVLIRAFTVHMHLRGKSFVVKLWYPDGRVETVLEVPKFSFNWQRFYKLAKPIPVVKGTVAEFIATWDNSAKNPYNPDPTKEVRFGEKTTDEMMSGTILYEIPEENLNLMLKNGRQVSTDANAHSK